MRFVKCCALPENHHSTQKYRSMMYPERKSGFMILDSPSYVTTNFFCAKEISSTWTECHSMSNSVQPMMSTTLVASINIAWWLMFDPNNVVGINCSVGKQAGVCSPDIPHGFHIWWECKVKDQQRLNIGLFFVSTDSQNEAICVSEGP